MAGTEVAINRPQRWDTPFGESMGAREVEQLLRVAPFSQIDASAFPASLPLHEILRNDTRIETYAPGDLIVREGDYGSSAFLILSGQLRVVLAGLSPESLGRDIPQHRSWWSSLKQLAAPRRQPEVRWQQSAPAKETFSQATPQTNARGNSQPNNETDDSDLLTARRPNSTRVFLQDVPRILSGTDNDLLSPGEFFGEFAALTRSQRTATVFAETESILVEIRWQGLRDLMRGTALFREHIEKLYRENSLRMHLRETPLLANLPTDKLDQVAAATLFRSHGDFDWHNQYEAALRGRRGDAIAREPLIAEEQTPVDGLVLVRAGFARLSQRHGHGHRTASYLGKGQVFGLAEAVESYRQQKRVPLHQSLRALGYVDTLHISQQTLESLVLPHVTQEALDEAMARSPMIPTEAAIASPTEELSEHASTLDQGLLEFLVERRFINGQKSMVIDLERCIRCDDCVVACAATHEGNPRFVRQGERHGPIQIANACMHCVDPVCMIGCPTGAIGRDQTSGVVRINDQTCIGCGMCSDSCPYDNIRLVEIRDHRGVPVVDSNTRQPIAKATKCDFCIDDPNGPACVSACSHDALARLDLGNLTQLTDWLDR